MTPALRKYLEFERLMLVLDEDSDDTAAEALRDAMDPLWYSLTDDDRRILNERKIGRIASIEEIRVPASSGIFGTPLVPTAARAFPDGPIGNWRIAA